VSGSNAVKYIFEYDLLLILYKSTYESNLAFYLENLGDGKIY